MGKQENQEWLHNLRVLFGFFKTEASESSHNEGILLTVGRTQRKGVENATLNMTIRVSEALSNTRSFWKTVEKIVNE